MKWCAAAVAALGLMAAGCDRATTESVTTSPAAQQLKTDMHGAGQELRQDTTKVTQELKPELQKAGQEAREGIHEAANKVSNWTATQP
ncbi:MAG TPA: hypothetical protein VHQ47_20015 [Phycisphaerae bacterium]|jgi:hypothetical protein|nr:hypothetical protein [Phycisphaerae bacterium]